MATSTSGTSTIPQSLLQPIPAGMRCVICVGDLDLEARVQEAIERTHGMVAVACANHWHHCEQLIAEYCPELLVLAGTITPIVNSLQGPWPFVLKIAADPEPRDGSAVSFQTGAFERALRNMQARIIEQKSVELRELLSNYLQATAKQYRTVFEILDSNTTRVIKVEDVAFISVEGNYAVLNTTAGAFRFRETLNSLSETLDPNRFVRIHRSAIVNLSVVEQFVDGPGGAALVLRDGTRLQVGPTFKSLENFLPSNGGC